jgi:hypothetical protein
MDEVPVTITILEKKMGKLKRENAGRSEIVSADASTELRFINEICSNSAITDGNKTTYHLAPFA